MPSASVSYRRRMAWSATRGAQRISRAPASSGCSRSGSIGSETVVHPDGGLFVEAGVALAVDLYRDESTGDDVGAGFGERHAGPGFPVRDGAAHDEVVRVDGDEL